MDEDLHGQVGLPADAGDLAEGELAGQDHPGAAQLARQLDARFAGDRHLRRAVDLEIRGDRPDQPGQADVLDDDRVNAGRRDFPHGFFEIRQFRGEDERVQGDVAPDAATVEQGHGPGQVGDVEVMGAHPGIVAREAEVDGIGTIFHRGQQAGPIAGRCQELGPGPSRAVRRPPSVSIRHSLHRPILRRYHGTPRNRDDSPFPDSSPDISLPSIVLGRPAWRAASSSGRPDHPDSSGLDGIAGGLSYNRLPHEQTETAEEKPRRIRRRRDLRSHATARSLSTSHVARSKGPGALFLRPYGNRRR